MSKYSALWDYVAKCGEGRLVLSFVEIEKISGVKMDHSFLKYKKELVSFGWQVEKISMKAQEVLFVKC